MRCLNDVREAWLVLAPRTDPKEAPFTAQGAAGSEPTKQAATQTAIK